jgi:hypothetical protein
MSILTLIFVVLILTIALFKLMSLCRNRDKKLIAKLYVLLAVIYFVVGPRLIHLFLELLVFDHANLGTAFVEMMFFSSLYLSIVLSALLGILVYFKDRPMMLEFLKSFALLVVMFPIGLMIG